LAGKKRSGFYNRVFGGFSKERDRPTVSANIRRSDDVDALSVMPDLVLARGIKAD
jgi:hypothetical protein